MTKIEFEKLKGDKKKLLIKICDEYIESINKSSIDDILFSLETYIGDINNYKSVGECFKFAIQDCMSLLFIEKLNKLKYDIDKVFEELINMCEDEGTGCFIWEFIGEDTSDSDLLMKIFDKKCDEIIDIYLKKFPELFKKMLLIEF